MNDFEKQPFYFKLKSKTIRDTIAILSKSKHNRVFKYIEYLIYGILLYLLYLTIPAFIGNFNLSSFIILIIAFVLISYLLPVIKKTQKNYTDMTDKYRDNLSKQICNCSDKCTCTNQLKDYLKNKKVKLL